LRRRSTPVEALDPILPARIDALTHRVLTEAHLRGKALATAESCTGGLLASLLTDLPGCSHVFERGFVTYTNEAKTELLGVDPKILSGPGPVSHECAEAMAAGALARSRANVAVSVTGWTEGVGDPDKPAGLVYLGCAANGRAPNVRELRLRDIGRAKVRMACLEAGLEMFVEALAGR